MAGSNGGGQVSKLKETILFDHSCHQAGIIGSLKGAVDNVVTHAREGEIRQEKFNDKLFSFIDDIKKNVNGLALEQALLPEKVVSIIDKRELEKKSSKSLSLGMLVSVIAILTAFAMAILFIIRVMSKNNLVF